MHDGFAEQKDDVIGRRAVLVEALDKALEIFCSHDKTTFEEEMAYGLRPIAEASEVSRIIIFRHIELSEEKCFKQLYCWDTVKGRLAEKNMIPLPFNETTTGWIHILLKNTCVNQRLCDMPENEKAYMDKIGIRSIFIVPIFSEGALWGGVAYLDHCNDRLFGEECMGFMRSTARLCSNAVIHHEREQ